jgi:hypothetical protein
MRDRRVYPVPELLGLDIRVKSGGGSMNNVERLMRVPLTDSPASRHIRAHEMTHAKYSPKRPTGPAGLPEVAIQRAEDMRMNVYGLRSGLDEALSAPTTNDPSVISAIVCDPLNARTALCACYRTGDWPAVLDAAGQVLAPEALAEAISRVESAWSELDASPNPSWEDALRIAQLMADDESPEDESPEDEGSGGGSGEAGEAGGPGGEESTDGDAPAPPSPPSDSEPDDSTRDDSDDSDDSAPPEGKSPAERGPERELVPIDLGADPLDIAAERELAQETEGRPRVNAKALAADNLVAQNIRLEELPLTRKTSIHKMRARSYRPSDRGRVPVNMHRYATDRAIFNERGKRRIEAGTILVDCSYVSGLNNEQMMRLLDVAPAAKIASYKGCWVNREGILFVLADRGKRTEAPNLIPPIRCNCCNAADIPVLEWLATQEGPLIWLCKDDPSTWNQSGADQTLKEREALLRKHKITRFESYDEMVRAIRGGHVR